MEKKSINYLFYFLTLLFIPLANANILDTAQKELNSRFSVLASSDILLMYISIFMIIFILIYESLSKISAFKDNPVLIFTIGFIISIFSIRYMTQNQIILGFLLPYGLMGAFFSFFLPFCIFLFIIHAMHLNRLVRKVAWIFYAFAFLFLFIKDYSSLTKFKLITYLVNFGVIVLAIVLDSWIQKIFEKRVDQ